MVKWDSEQDTRAHVVANLLGVRFMKDPPSFYTLSVYPSIQGDRFHGREQHYESSSLKNR